MQPAKILGLSQKCACCISACTARSVLWSWMFWDLQTFLSQLEAGQGKVRAIQASPRLESYLQTTQNPVQAWPAELVSSPN